MDLISDILLASATLGAMVYCFILARRLNQLNDLDKGMGGAIAVLSVQVDDMTKALGKAQNSAALSRSDLLVLTERSEKAAQKLELILASMHDISEVQDDYDRVDQFVGSKPNPQPTQAAPEFTQSNNPAKSDSPTWRTRRSVKEAV